MSDEYIPNARDATVAYHGRDSQRSWRTRCVCCCELYPLTEANRIYGDLYVSDGPIDRADDDSMCDTCGVSLLDLSRRCQVEHDAQQARWAHGPITHVVEMGMPGAVRCRIY